MAVVDIRGTHGSGKSWVMHRLLSVGEPISILEDGQHIGYHLCRYGAALLGKYANVCGGCDQLSGPKEVERRIRLFAAQYRHVLLEGILVSHTFGRYSALAKELVDYGYLFCFLDTPLKVCVDRVRARRRARHDSRPFNPKNVIKDYHGVWKRVQSACREAGHDVVVLPWRKSLNSVIRLLIERGV